ncbi:MAG: ABC transporter substrate-binding protein [Frankia sp.]|nr:ABC transporter substrate-binding protein [Frankia sp.]
MRARRLVSMVAASAAVAVMLAACGDDDSTTGGGGSGGDDRVAEQANDLKVAPPVGWDDGGFAPDVSELRCGQTASNPTRGITDTEIKVGGLAYLTSPSGSTMSGTEVGAEVRFRRANEEGGVHGRTINYIGVLDEGNDPARNGAQAQVLAEQEQVFAAVPVMTARANYFDTFCDKTVPFFGWGFNEGFCNSSIGFGITGCLLPNDEVTSTTYGIMMQGMFPGEDLSTKTVALVGSDDDSARRGNNQIANQFESVGIKVAYNENPIPVAGLTDATALVNDLMTANNGAPPDLIMLVTDFATTLKLTEALKAAGYPNKLMNAVGYDPRLETFEPLFDSYVLLQFTPTQDSSSDAVKQLVADFEKYAPDQPISLPAMAGYWAADMFLTAVEEVGRDLTVDALLAHMNDNWSFSVEGALAETRWPINHWTSSPCAALVQLTSDGYQVPMSLGCGRLVKR